MIPEAERDERVKLALRTDPDVQSAILAWAVKGCLEWQQRGLDVPASRPRLHRRVPAEKTRCATGSPTAAAADPDAWTSTAELRASYEQWCETNGEKPLSRQEARNPTRSQGLPAESPDGTRGRRGIRVN